MPLPSTGVLRLALALVVVASVCGSPVAAAGAGAGHVDASAACTPGVMDVERDEAAGDVLALDVRICSSGSVALEGPDYAANVSLADGVEATWIRLHVNTHLRGANALTATSLDGDPLPVEATGSGAFEPGTYDVVVRNEDGLVVDEGALELQEARARDVTLWRAPRDAASSLDSTAGLRASRETARYTDSNGTDYSSDASLPVATNETLVVELDASGLEGAVTATNGSALTRLRSAFDATRARFSVVQTEATTPPSRQPFEPDVLNSSATHAVVDPENDTYYLVVDTERLWDERGGTRSEPTRIGAEPGLGFLLGFSMQASPDETEVPGDLAVADFLMVEPDVTFPRAGSESLRLTPDSDARVVVHSRRAPGSTVTIDVTGATNQSIMRTVQARPADQSPGFVLTLDLSTVANGSELTFRHRNPHDTDESNVQHAVVIEPTASLAAPDATPAASTLTVPSVTVSHPSVVAVYAADRTLVGTATLQAGATTEKTIPLDTPADYRATLDIVVYRDADRSGSLTRRDVVYRQGDAPVSQTVSVTDSVTTRSTSTSRPTTVSTQPSTTSTSTGASVPGAGVGVALLAVLASLVLGRRRA